MTRASKLRRSRKVSAAPITRPPEFDFPVGEYPLRISVGIAPAGKHVVELVVGNFDNEAVAKRWAAALQAMIERYAGGQMAKGKLN